jgi:putative transcriptional regulator
MRDDVSESLELEEDRTELGRSIEQGLREAIAHARGELPATTIRYAPMTPERVKRIRRGLARSTKAFEKRFGIPAATMNNYEQGRRQPDAVAVTLLRVIEANPAAVEAALASAPGTPETEA